MTKISLEQRSH